MLCMYCIPVVWTTRNGVVGPGLIVLMFNEPLTDSFLPGLLSTLFHLNEGTSKGK